MKYKIKQSGRTQKIIEFHVSKELISEELGKIYQEISRSATLPGFRQGKAPLELIKKKYKKEATDEAVKGILSDSFKKAMGESDIDMLGFPEISDLTFDEEKGMSYKATVNVRPQIKLKGYKGLKLKEVKKEINEKDIDSEIDSLRNMSAKFVTREGSAREGDYLICNVDSSVKGHAPEKKENVWLHVGDDSFIPGKELENLKTGD